MTYRGTRGHHVYYRATGAATSVLGDAIRHGGVEFDWGANTPGAEALARFLIAQTEEFHDLTRAAAEGEVQEFKRLVVATLPEEWEVDSRAIVEWLNGPEGRAADGGLKTPPQGLGRVSNHYFRQQQPDCQHCGQPGGPSRIKLTVVTAEYVIGTHRRYIAGMAVANDRDNPSRRAGRKLALARLMGVVDRLDRAGEYDHTAAAFEQASSRKFRRIPLSDRKPDGDTIKVVAANRGVRTFPDRAALDAFLDSLRRAEQYSGHAAAGRVYERAFRATEPMETR